MATAKESATKMTVAQAKKRIEDLENKVQTLKDGAWCYLCNTHKARDKFYVSTDPLNKSGLSARIRGAKTELEEAGEDTDGMVESTSKLQALIKGMTGFDIMESDGKTFKDIYDIIIGIGEKWNDLSDINRASLLEKLAGKNQSNALAAALSNIDVLKKSYEEATHAEGSAREENEEYAKSIQASIDQTKAKLEELANDTLNSNFLKGAIDAGGKLIDILDGIVKSGNAIPAVATAIGAALSFKNVGRDKLYSLSF